MSNAVEFRQKTVVIEDVEYTLQKIPFSFYLDILDRNKNSNGVLQNKGYMEDMFKHVVVSPKVNLNSFNNNFQAGSELVKEIENFLASKPEHSQDKTES